MSRNLDLLQRAEKDRRVSSGRTPTALQHQGEQPLPIEAAIGLKGCIPQTAITPCVSPITGISRTEHRELTRFVHRVFIGASPETSRVIIFLALEQNNSGAHIAACASDLLAQNTRASVCALEANLMRPGLCEQFALQASGRGLCGALAEKGDISEFTRRVSHNLWVMSAGTEALTLRSAPTLDTESVQRRMAELRATFDYLLISAANVALETQAMPIAQMTDGSVLVIEAGVTRRSVAEQCRAVLDAANIPVLGAVLNNRTFPIPEVLYSRL